MFEALINNLLQKYSDYCETRSIKRKCSGADVLMLNIPTHGNLGDHAIAIAEKQFFEKNFKNKKYVEISCADLFKNEYVYKSMVKPNTLICITGGGYLGSIWPNEEENVSRIIELFEKNKIIIFPQTIYYDSSPEGRKMLDAAKVLYFRNKDRLFFFLREKKSLEFFNINFPTIEAQLVPDMVLGFKTNIRRTRVGEAVRLCFRKDKERIIDGEKQEAILKWIEENNYNVEEISTVIPDNMISYSNREERVNDILSTIASSRFVITDRLHAMIFCAITGTPCLVYDNLSNKVTAVHEWIKNLPYITIAGQSIESDLNNMKLTSSQEYVYNLDFITEKFKAMRILLTRLFEE